MSQSQFDDGTTQVTAPKPVESAAHRVWFRRYPMARFLAALVLMCVAAPFEELFSDGDFIEVILLTIVLLSALPALGGRRKTLVWAACFVAPALVAKWVNHLWPDSVSIMFYFIPSVMFLAFVVAHLLQFILRSPRIDSEVLCAGVAGYLMLGVLWAGAYVLIDHLLPGAFVFTAGFPTRQVMKGFTSIYFSFITLSTVGYGDITPVSSVARMLAMMEAITGTLYMAVLVARLVSLHSSTSASVKAGGQGDS